MIQFAEPLNAADAFTCGFVAKLMPHSNFPQEAKKLVEKYQTLSPEVRRAYSSLH
jgi:enoyl-CoA hydratase/carnithine racemase